MTYKPKPELEEGNYIAYTNEPDTVVDSAGSGGGGEGGGQFEPYNLKIAFTAVQGAAEVTTPEDFNGIVTVNGVGVTGFEIETLGDIKAAVATVSVNPLDFISIDDEVLNSRNYFFESIAYPEGYIPHFSFDGGTSTNSLYAGTYYGLIASDNGFLFVYVSKNVS